MNKQERENYLNMRLRLERMGIDYMHFDTLRRISMQLQRWHERECGDSNEYGAWCIVRGRMEKQQGAPAVFVHDDDGAAFMERHSYRHGKGADTVAYHRIRDMETGARRRLASIMENYPALVAYVQTDPRGAALYIVERARVPVGVELDCCYSSYGVAVY